MSVHAAVPFVFGEPRVILGIDNREFALGQRNESYAVAIRQRGSLGGFEVGAGIVWCDDEEFCLWGLFMVAD